MHGILHHSLLLFGMAMFLGLSGGKLFRFFRIPQVVGFIVIGVVLGISGFGIFDRETIQNLGPFTNFALGVIGFMIGGEIKLATFRKYGTKIITILLCEGLAAYALVGVFTYLVTGNVAIAIFLAALASATAPAATVDVIWEYRAKGVLATTILAIVALDDGLSLILYALSKVFAESVITGADFSFVHSIGHPLLELSSTLMLGVLAGIAVYFLLRYIHEVKEKESFLIISLGAVLTTTGIASVLNLDLILCNMALGMTLANMGPKRSHFLFSLTKQVVSPIYVVFFVLVGARLDLRALGTMGAIGVVYLVFRTAGKMGGAYVGGWLAKAHDSVRKYLGMSLFSQAGVAIGLAIAIDNSFSRLGPQGMEIGHLIINVITATTIIVQIIGPPSVKWSLHKAGETGKAMSEDEILAAHRVSEIMSDQPKPIHETDSYNMVIRRLKTGDFVYFPVIDDNDNFRGAIQLDYIRSILFEDQLTPLLRATDLMMLGVSTVHPKATLADAKEIFDFEEFDYVPVVDGHGKLRGVVERAELKEFVKRQLWEAEMA